MLDCRFQAAISGLCDIFSVYCGVEVGKGERFSNLRYFWGSKGKSRWCYVSAAQRLVNEESLRGKHVGA